MPTTVIVMTNSMEEADSNVHQSQDQPLRKSTGDSGSAMSTPLTDMTEMSTEVIEVIEEESERTETETAELAEAAPLVETTTTSSPTSPQTPWSECLMTEFVPEEKTSDMTLLSLSAQLATDRALVVTRCSLRCASLLLEVASLYETFGVALDKAAKSLQASTTKEPFVLVPQLQASARSWSLAVAGYAQTLRTAIAQPANTCLKTQELTLQSMQLSLAKAKTSTEQYQQKTFLARQKYTKTITGSITTKFDDETKMDPLLGNISSNNTSPTRTGGTAAVSPPPSSEEGQQQPSVGGSPKQQQHQQQRGSLPTRTQTSALNHFRKVWTKETGKFKELEMLTAFFLDSAQQLEGDRLAVLVHSLIKLLAAQLQAWQDMQILIQEAVSTHKSNETAANSNDSSVPLGTMSEGRRSSANKNNLMKQLLKSNSGLGIGIPGASSYDQDDLTLGAMDADTLGLPVELGQLRDQVRAKIAGRNQRLSTVRMMAAFCEALAAANAKLGLGLKTLLVNSVESIKENMITASLTQPELELQQYESPQVVQLWNTLQSTLEFESKGALALASSLRTLRSDRLDKVVLYGDRNSKVSADYDDAQWKQLCDAARSQARAESRYRQTTVQTERARERVKSVESASAANNATISNNTGGGNSTFDGSLLSNKMSSDISKVNKHVSKSIANVFSILPDRGEGALKIFAPGARANIAKQGLEEADTKEVKVRQLLDAAVETSSRAMENYKSHAAQLVDKYDIEEKSGWEDVRLTVETFVSLLESLRSSRIREASTAVTAATTNTTHPVRDLAYLDEWNTKAQKHILSKKVEMEASIPKDGFAVPPPEVVNNEEPSERYLDSSVRSSMDDDDAIDASSAAASDIDFEQEGESEGFRDGITTPRKNSEDQNCDVSFHSSSEGSQQSLNQSHNSGNWLRTLSGGNSPQLLTQKSDRAVRSKITFGLGTTKSSDSGGGGGIVGSGIGIASKKRSNPDLPTEVFLSYFWPDPVDRKTVPPVVDSFACSFQDSTQRLPSQYGRVFASSSRIIFTSWTGKKLNLRWADVLELEPVSSFMDSADDTIMVTFRKSATEEVYVLLGGFYNRQRTMQVFGKLRDEASSAPMDVIEPTQQQDKIPRTVVRDVVPPDVTVGKMEKVLTRHLRNISIERFYEIVWSEGEGTSEKPLYGPWLEKKCFDVHVGAWETNQKAVGPWCGETYQQKRVVKFKVQRKTHLYIGPPIANVIQTQFCRVEGNSKCVLNMTVEFEGIPYSDTFAVEVRWVARKEGQNDILVEVGCFVDFKKNTFLKAKIRSGTIEETAPIHTSLFDTVKAACVAAGGEDVEEPEEVEEAALPSEAEGAFGLMKGDIYTIAACGAMLILVILWRALFSGGSVEVVMPVQPPEGIVHLGNRIDELEGEIKAVRATLDEILTLLKTQAENQQGITLEL